MRMERVVFVGGPVDGEWLSVDRAAEEWPVYQSHAPEIVSVLMVLSPDDGSLVRATYRRERLCTWGGVQAQFFVVEEMRLEDALRALVRGYRGGAGR